MGFVGIFMCIYSLIIKDNRGAIYFLVFFLVCGIMFYVRRRQRIKFDEAQKQKEQNK